MVDRAYVVQAMAPSAPSRSTNQTRGWGSGAGIHSYLQHSPQPCWQQAGLQLPAQHVPQAALADLICEVWAMAATERTTTSESIAIVRFMICLL